MAMFDKLIRKGKKMAGDYVREQLGQGSGNGVQRGGQQSYGTDSSGYGNRGYGNQPQRGSAPGYGNQQQGYPEQPHGYGQGQSSNRNAGPAGQHEVSREDQAAVAKYKYMLRTAPPEEMERAHTEAFSKLTPQQRSLLQEELAEELPAAERPATDQPQDLARAATRAEVSRPGFMEKMLGNGRSGRPGMGGLAAGAAGGLGAGLLAGVAGAFIGTAVAGPLLDGFAGMGEEFSGAAEGLTDGVAGAGEEVAAAGEGLSDQAGGLMGGLFGGGGGGFGGEGGGFGGFGGDGGGFGDFEV